MKKHLCTAICTVIFAALILTGCTGNKSTAAASGKDYTQQQTQGHIADAADRTKDPAESAAPSESVTEREGQTEKETEGQTVKNEAQTDKKGGTMTEGEQQTKPQPPKKGTATTTPETEAPKETPVQSAPKPVTPVSPETPAETKAPAQSTQKPVTPAETKAPVQTQKPSTPAQPETQAPTKAPAQTSKPETQAPTKAPVQTPKPTDPAQPETQAPIKAPELPKKEKTMWDAPYDVEAIKAYMVAELKARGYVDNTDYEAVKKLYQDLSKKYGYEYNLSYDEWKESILPASPFGENLRAWDNFCTATAGPNRYYDNINHCTVGHQHYNWSNPATGAGERKNSEGLTSLEFYVNDAIDYWCYMYGEGHMFPEEYREESKFTAFYLYVEEFSDGCVIFYILA